MKWRWIITTTWVMLLGLLIVRSVWIPRLDTNVSSVLAKAKEKSWYGVWFQNQRIGYVENHLQSKGEGTFTMVQRARLRLNVLNQIRQIDMRLTADLNVRQRLQSFAFTFHSPFYTMDAKGTISGQTLHLATATGGNQRKETIPLPEAPFISTNHRAYLVNPLPEKGEKRKIPFFDPMTLSSRESVITYMGQEKLLIKKRIHRLHHFESRHSGIRIHFYLDDEGKVIKEESPAGFVFLAEPEFRATDIEDGDSELLQAVAVSYTGKLPTGDRTAAIAYRLTLPDDISFDLNGGRQRFEKGVLHITREALAQLPTGASKNEIGCENQHYLEPSRLVQSDHKEIIDQGKTVAGDDEKPLEVAKALAEWVYEQIDKRPVIGLPDALATLQNRKGDCNEHAALFAALARSRGIPTRIAAGVTLHQGKFYYHAWNEVCVNGEWISLDTTNNQFPADLMHIRLIHGDLEDHLRIGAVLGKLKIEILE